MNLASVFLALTLAPAAASPPPPPPAAPVTAPADTEPGDDLIGELVVEATEGDAQRARRLYRIELHTEDDAHARTNALAAIVAHDLELSGMFEVFRTPDAQRLTDFIVVIRRANDAETGWIADMTRRKREPASVEVTSSDPDAMRLTAHRLTDAIVETATGTPTHFSGRLAAVRREGDRRRLFTSDVDGSEATAISPPSHLIAAVAFAPDGTLYWTASIEGGAYRLHRETQPAAIDVGVRGSIYGIAFRGRRFAASIADGTRIQLWEGPDDFTALKRRSHGPLAQSPTFVSDISLATIEDKRGGPRVRFAARTVSDTRRAAASLTFCDSEDPQLVWVEHTRRSSFVFRLATRRPREEPTRVMAVRGEIRGLVCSPDGRTLAAAYAGKALQGDGVYLMGVNRARPTQVIKGAAGALHWSRGR